VSKYGIFVASFVVAWYSGNREDAIWRGALHCNGKKLNIPIAWARHTSESFLCTRGSRASSSTPPAIPLYAAYLGSTGHRSSGRKALIPMLNWGGHHAAVALETRGSWRRAAAPPVLHSSGLDAASLLPRPRCRPAAASGRWYGLDAASREWRCWKQRGAAAREGRGTATRELTTA
jgi:hypothetical protein